MPKTNRPIVTYDVERICVDLALKGWNGATLARKTRVSRQTISNFLNRRFQSVDVAVKIAKALGKPVERYLMGPWAEKLAG